MQHSRTYAWFWFGNVTLESWFSNNVDHNTYQRNQNNKETKDLGGLLYLSIPNAQWKEKASVKLYVCPYKTYYTATVTFWFVFWSFGRLPWCTTDIPWSTQLARKHVNGCNSIVKIATESEGWLCQPKGNKLEPATQKRKKNTFLLFNNLLSTTQTLSFKNSNFIITYSYITIFGILQVFMPKKKFHTIKV